jgi:hypothetical protein
VIHLKLIKEKLLETGTRGKPMVTILEIGKFFSKA